MKGMTAAEGAKLSSITHFVNLGAVTLDYDSKEEFLIRASVPRSHLCTCTCPGSPSSNSITIINSNDDHIRRESVMCLIMIDMILYI